MKYFAAMFGFVTNSLIVERVDVKVAYYEVKTKFI